MENKINLAELLKDCPKGMELDCTIWNNIVFEEINGNSIVIFRKSSNAKVYLTRYGEFNSIDGKCVIFPKGKTTWEGFVPPCEFKDGDILATDLGSVFYLNTRLNIKECYGCYVGIGCDGSFYICETFAYKECCRFATEEEKQKLFQAIKDNGYKWNAETKTLEKFVEPKFKVGDKIKSKDSKQIINIITKVYENSYELNDGRILLFNCQNDWELVHDKFDINTLIPFESKVLVRTMDNNPWKPATFGCVLKNSSCIYVALGGVCWRQCIPYEGNEHLLGTTNDCDEFYKTWE